MAVPYQSPAIAATLRSRSGGPPVDHGSAPTMPDGASVVDGEHTKLR
jgi:hypothetical protein